MAEIGAPLAGEMSGHIFFADRFYGFDDALYCGLRLLEHRGRRPARAWPRCATRCPSRSTRRSCASTARRSASSRSSRRSRRACSRPAPRSTTSTACASARADGWWLLRASNTQAGAGGALRGRRRGGPRAAQGRTQGGAVGKRRQPAGRGVCRAPLMRFFFYGTLLDHDVTALVLGRRLPPAAFLPARLPGHARRRARAPPIRSSVRDPRGVVPGVIVRRAERPRRGAARRLRRAALSHRAAARSGQRAR